MRSPRLLALAACAALVPAACDSERVSTVDQELQARFETISDCLPSLYRWVEGLLAIADTWRLNDGQNPPDPAGLTWAVVGQDIEVGYVLDGTTISMTISFYGPAGNKQDAAALIGGATRLSDAIDNAATELRNLFGSLEKHIHGVWSIAGGGIVAAGEAINGEIGGSANANELAVLRTTLVNVTTGIPAVDPSSIADAGPPPCTLQFEIPALYTDEEPGQEYPRGVVEVLVQGSAATVAATITFDKTAIASVVVDGIAGSFAFDLTTRQLTYVP